MGLVLKAFRAGYDFACDEEGIDEEDVDEEEVDTGDWEVAPTPEADNFDDEEENWEDTP